MMTNRMRRGVPIAMVVLLVACGGDVEPRAAGEDDATSGDAAAPVQTGSGSGGGSVTIDAETIALDRTLCTLEAQEVAESGGGGTMEMVGGGRGTNAAGEEVRLDFTRFGADSRFAGDMVTVVVGDYREDESVSLSGTAEPGTVEVVGSEMTVTELPLTDDADGSEVMVSFQIDC